MNQSKSDVARYSRLYLRPLFVHCDDSVLQKHTER
jgi:hypothetical protein